MASDAQRAQRLHREVVPLLEAGKIAAEGFAAIVQMWRVKTGHQHSLFDVNRYRKFSTKTRGFGVQMYT
jgi:hypothetical protein